MSQKIYAFYNNKGGVGKTTLCQNAACLYAENNPETQVIVIDLCPQANISQFLLGGGHKGYQTNQRIQASSTRRNIVGFMDWILKGNSGFTSIKNPYAIQVNPYNDKIADNLYLIAGDSFLESLSLALNYAVINPANKKAWPEYMTAINRLCELEFNQDRYSDLTVFIDCNPSFSIYTQMGLVSSDRIIVPMMADFSSLEGIKSLMMLLYGQYPSAALKTYAEDVVTFNGQIEQFGLPLPKLYEFVFNNFTTNAGVAYAFDSVRNELIDFCYAQYSGHSGLFFPCEGAISDRSDWEEYFVSNTKDFHTSAKVSASLGIPLHKLPEATTYIMPDGTEVKIPPANYSESLANVRSFVGKIG
ncbi:ParA family protein [Burkholderia cenocepacia]|uniref:ParA family protein n=1 Tax=Burkholderia cenocepacia TaxID=95486 RepID=UPI001BA2D040|nr:ParA family protein [Burkholderia cenocepacia]MBR8074610.1 ParA family protein [Burkholderia cenocepacia]MBR8449406.1 ParA family protein [Burkholderia cenocepacia]